MENIYNQLIQGLKEFSKVTHLKRAVIGLSGGVDSSLVLKLAVDALGARNVVGIIMPELKISAAENMQHAKKLAEFFGIQHFKVPINPLLVDYTHLPWKSSDMAFANTKARVRMTMLYNFANSHGAMVLGTSNRSEVLLGYGTKHGDFAADVEVIADLFKTEVWQLADFVGLPPEIIEKPPTAELFAGQTDEKELGASYRELDPILKNYTMGVDKMVSKGMNPSLVRKVLAMIKKNEHKQQMPPTIAVARG